MNYKISISRVFSVIVLGALATAEASATRRAPSKAGSARIRFAEHSKNFGTVLRGEQLTHRFVFTNTGGSPLKIHGVHVACGCTVVNFDKSKTYAPGEKGEIEILFRTERFEGPHAKTVTVSTNEHHLASRILTVRADIKSEFKATPPLVDFQRVYSQDSIAQQVVISPRSGFQLKIHKLEFDKQLIAADTSQRGRDWHLNVTLLPGKPSGFLKTSIRLHTNSASLPVLELPIRADVVGNISISPTYVEFGAINRRESQKRQVALVGKHDIVVEQHQLEISLNGEKLSNANSFMSVKLTPNGDHRSAKLLLELSNHSELAGSVHGKIGLKTNDKLQRVINVDFYAFFR